MPLTMLDSMMSTNSRPSRRRPKSPTLSSSEDRRAGRNSSSAMRSLAPSDSTGEVKNRSGDMCSSTSRRRRTRKRRRAASLLRSSTSRRPRSSTSRRVAGSLSRNPLGPVSQTKPWSRTDAILPPGVSAASRTTTSTSRAWARAPSRMRHPAARPEMPPPTTTTRAVTPSSRTGACRWRPAWAARHRRPWRRCARAGGRDW